MNQKLLGQIDAINRQHAAAADYEKTLALLAALKAGEVSLAEVELTGGGWQLVEKPAAQPEPELTLDELKRRVAMEGTNAVLNGVPD